MPEFWNLKLKIEGFLLLGNEIKLGFLFKNYKIFETIIPKVPYTTVV
jgi:hypothetical protein